MGALCINFCVRVALRWRTPVLSLYPSMVSSLVKSSTRPRRDVSWVGVSNILPVFSRVTEDPPG